MDEWLESDAGGWILPGNYFLIHYRCDRPFTQEEQHFFDTIIEPAGTAWAKHVAETIKAAFTDSDPLPAH